MYKTKLRLSFITFTDQDILKIMKSLIVNKAHGYAVISIRMLKISDSEIVRPLSLTFRNCICCGIFTNIWEKSDLVPIHKKS